MAKQGMAHPERMPKQSRSEPDVVPEIQGKAKHGNEKANPLIAGTASRETKVYHAEPHSENSHLHSGYDNDLAADNLEIDLPEADRRND